MTSKSLFYCTDASLLYEPRHPPSSTQKIIRQGRRGPLNSQLGAQAASPAVLAAAHAHCSLTRTVPPRRPPSAQCARCLFAAFCGARRRQRAAAARRRRHPRWRFRPWWPRILRGVVDGLVVVVRALARLPAVNRAVGRARARARHHPRLFSRAPSHGACTLAPSALAPVAGHPLSGTGLRHNDLDLRHETRVRGGQQAVWRRAHPVARARTCVGARARAKRASAKRDPDRHRVMPVHGRILTIP